MERAPHILIADDDSQIRSGLARLLGGQGMRISQASNGSEVFHTFSVAHIDLVILDVMMPGEDGFSICRKLRGKSNVPIVLLSAVAGDTDRIVGLELGADDYICKPFLPRELVARLKTILRRANSLPAQQHSREALRYTFNGWQLDVLNRLLYAADGTAVDLTTGEFELLNTFIQRPQVVLSRDQLLDLAKGRALAPFDRSIDVQIMRLRRKIEIDPQAPQLIKTVRHRGYIFTPNVVATSNVGRA